MSKITADHVFTSESVSAGHPDKVCDQISDGILDACISADPKSRVACETLVAHNAVVNAGEITCSGWDNINTEAIARQVVKEIGYDREALKFWHESFEYISRLHGQSPDISMGVTEGQGLDKDQGAGDQGMMFGYATNETEDLMPCPIHYSHRLLRRCDAMRQSGEIAYLRPDAKSQVSILYMDGAPKKITTVVISHQTDDVAHETIVKDLKALAQEELGETGLLANDTDFYINPTGNFVLGGPYADAGLTGRKIIVDTYGGVGSHGGGAFSGKDPSKVDRSAAYFSRYAAKNIVAAGLAGKCEIQVSYAIGIAKPLSINVDTYGTGKVSETKLQRILEDGAIFDFRPANIIRRLGLLEPKGWTYRQTATYGHFGQAHFPWEQCNQVEALQEAAGLKVTA